MANCFLESLVNKMVPWFLGLEYSFLLDITQVNGTPKNYVIQSNNTPRFKGIYTTHVWKSTCTTPIGRKSSSENLKHKWGHKWRHCILRVNGSLFRCCDSNGIIGSISNSNPTFNECEIIRHLFVFLLEIMIK
jgi:hypothetical protein